MRSGGHVRACAGRSMKRPEQTLHIAVASYLRLALRPPTIWTSLDAGAGKMTKASAGLRKARGVMPGWPDILVIAPGPWVLGIELKASGTGRQSPAQREVEAGFHATRCWYVLCTSIESVEKALRFCKVPLHASVTAGNIGLKPAPAVEPLP